MTDVLWSVLIPTLATRARQFQQLVGGNLRFQISNNSDVELLVYWNTKERSLGEVRQALLEEARGEYVSFVDDDDELPHYYVHDIHETLYNEAPDYVGWRMQCIEDGRKLKPTYHSLQYDSWWDDSDGFYRDFSHLNPIKRSLALQADYRKGGMPEDRSWASQMREVRKTVSGDMVEVFLSQSMYTYHANSATSQWRLPGRITGHFQRPEFPTANWDGWMRHQFRYHPASLVEANWEPSKEER